MSVEFLGKNLFNMWTRVDWRRLSERDLEAKDILMDSAKEMDRAGTPEAVAGPVMVLLLARLSQHEGPATDWARRQIAGRGTIPEDVWRLVESK